MRNSTLLQSEYRDVTREMYSCRDSSNVSLTDTCRGICFVHPVPTSTSPPKTSAGTKALTTQSKTSSENKSNTLSGKITINHVSIVDFKICRRAISILCSFVSLKIGHLVKYSVISARSTFKDMYVDVSRKTPQKNPQKNLKN